MHLYLQEIFKSRWTVQFLQHRANFIVFILPYYGGLLVLIPAEMGSVSLVFAWKPSNCKTQQWMWKKNVLNCIPLNCADHKCQTWTQSAQELNGFLSCGLEEVSKEIRYGMRKSYTTEDLGTAMITINNAGVTMLTHHPLKTVLSLPVSSFVQLCKTLCSFQYNFKQICIQPLFQFPTLDFLAYTIT